MRASPPVSYASICFSKPKYLIYSSVHAYVFLHTDINTIFPIIMLLSESTDDQRLEERKPLSHMRKAGMQKLMLAVPTQRGPGAG